MRSGKLRFIFSVTFLLLETVRPARAALHADAGPDQRVPERSLVTLDGSHSTPDNQNHTLTFQWVQTEGPTVSLSNAASPTPTFSAPDVDSNGGAVRFRLIVTEGVETESNQVQINITNIDQANRKPTASIAPVSSVVPGDNVRLDGTGSSDPDGDTLAYRWEQTDGIRVTLNGA